MKKFTSLLIAALVAVVSFAGAPVRKSAPATLRQMTATRQLVPGKKAMTVSHPQVQNPLTKLTTSTRQKAPRKVSSISELEGKYILASIQFTVTDDNKLAIAEPPYGGTPVTITKKDERTIALSGFTSEATDDILATVDLSSGTITIADGQKLNDSSYGTVVIANAEEDDGDITGTINEDGSITLNQIWCTVLADGDYEGYVWSDF